MKDDKKLSVCDGEWMGDKKNQRSHEFLCKFFSVWCEIMQFHTLQLATGYFPFTLRNVSIFPPLVSIQFFSTSASSTSVYFENTIQRNKWYRTMRLNRERVLVSYMQNSLWNIT